MRKKLLFIFNPYSGKGLVKNNLFGIVDIMVKAGYEVTIYPTQASGDAIEKVVDDGASYDRIVCSGGDGTLNEVVSGMISAKIRLPLGYIPAGSTNDFANTIGIPKGIVKAAKTAVEGALFPCDVGSFNGSPFVYVAAFGLFTDVSYQTSQKLKNVFGHMAYLMTGFKSFINIPSFYIKAKADGGMYEGEFMMGMITNSYSVGGFKGITGRDVKLDDGLFDVTLIKKPKNPMEWNEIIGVIMFGNGTSDLVYSFHAKDIRIISRESIPWTMDGEFGGDHKKVHIRNHRKRLLIATKRGAVKRLRASKQN